MHREKLKTLYQNLHESRFDFVPAGEHQIDDIYRFVKQQFVDLCDDSYLCSENCRQGHNRPEWQHRTRAALWDLKKRTDQIDSGSQRGSWRFHLNQTDAGEPIIANDIESPTERIETTTYRILRDTALARRIKSLHDYQCQICGLAIELPNGRRYAEAHHIQPLGEPHDGPDVAGNIIVLCPNHHAMCDYFAITIDSSTMRMHPEHLVDSSFIQYHNDMVISPEMPR